MKTNRDTANRNLSILCTNLLVFLIVLAVVVNVALESYDFDGESVKHKQRLEEVLRYV